MEESYFREDLRRVRKQRLKIVTWRTHKHVVVAILLDEWSITLSIAEVDNNIESVLSLNCRGCFNVLLTVF